MRNSPRSSNNTFNKLTLTPTKLGTLLGLLTSSLFGFVYIVILHELGTAFYVFAFFAFLVGPFLAGVIAAVNAHGLKIRSFFAAAGTVFGIIFALFIFIYAFSIRLYTTSVEIPTFCDGSYNMAALPPNLNYEFPDGAKGILLLSDTRTAIVAKVDNTHSPRPTTLFLINKTNRNILGRITFPNDIVAVSMDTSTVYFFHEGLGHFIHKDTGTYEPYFLTMDTYGTNTNGFFETTGVISSWSTDGSVKLRPHLFFNGIAQGCYISGDSQNITKL